MEDRGVVHAGMGNLCDACKYVYILYVKLNFEAGIKIKILCLNTTSGAVYRLRG